MSIPSTPQKNSTVMPPATPSKLVSGGAVDDMAQGLINFLEPILQETDQQIKNVIESQNALSNQIDSLSEEMKKFAEISKIPALAPYVQKLADQKARITNVNQLLDRITFRLDRIHNMANSTD